MTYCAVSHDLANHLADVDRWEVDNELAGQAADKLSKAVFEAIRTDAPVAVPTLDGLGIEFVDVAYLEAIFEDEVGSTLRHRMTRAALNGHSAEAAKLAQEWAQNLANIVGEHYADAIVEMDSEGDF